LNLLSDIITYVRRLVKTPSNAALTDNLIIDYINRFWLMDVDARVQLFDLKTNYTFQTTPGIAAYNMPLYEVQIQPGSQTIAPFPVYQGFSQPAFVNGIQVPFYTEQNAFWNLWPNYTQFLNPAATGDGSAGPYTISLAQAPAIPGHLDVTGIIANYNAGNGIEDPYFANTFPLIAPANTFINLPSTSFYPGVYFTATADNGQLIQVSDSGIFLETASTTGDLYGLLMEPGNASFGNQPLPGGYSISLNTVNYATGVAVVTFPAPIPAGFPINAECLFFQPGLPGNIVLQ